jgi:hypothetical protein
MRRFCTIELALRGRKIRRHHRIAAIAFEESPDEMHFAAGGRCRLVGGGRRICAGTGREARSRTSPEDRQ